MIQNPIPATLLTLGVALGSIAPAQSLLSVPDVAAIAPGNALHRHPFGQPGFRTQLLVDASAIAANGATIQGIRFRSARGFQAGASIPNVTVSVSTTTRTLANVSPSFAANITSTPTVVFQGTVNRPAYANGSPALRPFDVFLPFASPVSFVAAQGNLLIDIRADNINPPSGIFDYWAEAAEPGGGRLLFGQSGALASFDTVGLSVGGISLASIVQVPPLELSIGRSVDFVTELFGTPVAGVLALSASFVPQPIDLGPLGATGNQLYIVPDALVALSWASSSFGPSEARFALPIPNSTLLVGVPVYGQSALFEPSSNALGLVTSNAVELILGDSDPNWPVRQIDVDDANLSTGVVLDLAPSGAAAPRFASAVFQLEGTFF